jgi:hypothetical protein
MSDIIIPHFTQSTLLAPYALAKQTVYAVPTTIDLTAKPGAFLHLGVGLGGSTNYTQGVEVLIRTLPASQSRFGDYWSARSRLDAGVRLINNGSGYNVGSSSFAFDGAAGTAFVYGDWLCCWSLIALPSAGAITPTGTGCEFMRACSTSTPLITPGGCVFTKIDNELITNASVWPKIWLAPGSVYELAFDSTANANGDVSLCYAVLETYDYDLKSTV